MQSHFDTTYALYQQYVFKQDRRHNDNQESSPEWHKLEVWWYIADNIAGLRNRSAVTWQH